MVQTHTHTHPHTPTIQRSLTLAICQTTPPVHARARSLTRTECGCTHGCSHTYAYLDKITRRTTGYWRTHTHTHTHTNAAHSQTRFPTQARGRTHTQSLSQAHTLRHSDSY